MYLRNVFTSFVVALAIALPVKMAYADTCGCSGPACGNCTIEFQNCDDCSASCQTCDIVGFNCQSIEWECEDNN